MCALTDDQPAVVIDPESDEEKSPDTSGPLIRLSLIHIWQFTDFQTPLIEAQFEAPCLGPSDRISVATGKIDP